jgi:parallel beta-helix repeat protein
VTGNTIANCTTGIYVEGGSAGTYQGNQISGNSYGFNYLGNSILTATNNNWGDPSGPLDDSDDRATGGLYNPNGLGNRVSDHVNYYPWVGSTAPPVPTGLAGTPEDSAINLTWNAVTDPSFDAYKIYYGTSSGSYGAPIKVGNVTSHKLTQLTNGTPYYIAISSVNTFGAESAKCTEIMVTPNSDTDKPTSTITQPLNGSNIYTNKFIIKGTADDGTGSGVQKVEVSMDGGTTWNLATGTTSWSYTWTIPGTGTYNIKSRAKDNANNEETPGAGIMVTVVNRQQTPVTVNGRKLMINGNPFTIKGVGYSPVPIGDDPETTSPYGDYFTSDYSSIYDRDLPLLRDMGANTIRLWGWNNTADHLDFLDKAYNGGVNPIYVVAGFWINPDLNIDPDSPDNVREQVKADFREMVAVHKNHPSILMWAIGNDLNADNMYGGNLDHLFSLINEMAEQAHAEEGANYHPVTTSLSDSDLISTIATYDSSVASLDVWAANVYRGNTFGTLFNDYEAVSQKPLAILEYGIDAFDNDNGNEYEKIGTPYQADYTEALWKEIESNSDTCIGGALMAYSDEWYKGEYSTDPGCPDNDSAYHSTCGYSASSDPDGYCNEEWWGIMRTKDSGDNPDVMEPRAVYYRMQSLWVQAPVFAVSGKVTLKNGSGISGVTMNFRKISGKGAVPSSVLTDADGNWSQSGFEPGTKYRVTPAKTNFIFTPSFRNFSDTRTDLNFTGEKAITIVSPNGGEVWKRGTYHVIKWQFNGNPGPYVRIELLKNGVVNSIIHKSYPIDVWNSRYPWVIPVNQAPGKNYRIRVTSTFNSSYSDTSNKTFTITK